MYRDFQRSDSDSRMHLEAPRLHPDESAALALIHYMSTSELTEYSNDDEKLDGLIKDLHQVLIMSQCTEELIRCILDGICNRKIISVKSPLKAILSHHLCDSNEDPFIGFLWKNKVILISKMNEKIRN